MIDFLLKNIHALWHKCTEKMKTRTYHFWKSLIDWWCCWYALVSLLYIFSRGSFLADRSAGQNLELTGEPSQGRKWAKQFSQQGTGWFLLRVTWMLHENKNKWKKLNSSMKKLKMHLMNSFLKWNISQKDLDLLSKGWFALNKLTLWNIHLYILIVSVSSSVRRH